MPYNPKSLDNLKKRNVFAKNNKVGGRKKLPDIDKLLDDALSEKVDGMSNARAIVLKQIKLARSGDQRAAEYILDRAYGKPKQQIENTNLNIDALKAFFEDDQEIIGEVEKA